MSSMCSFASTCTVLKVLCILIKYKDEWMRIRCLCRSYRDNDRFMFYIFIYRTEYLTVEWIMAETEDASWLCDRA